MVSSIEIALEYLLMLAACIFAALACVILLAIIIAIIRGVIMAIKEDKADG